MNDLISTAILIANLFGGTVAADRIYVSVRKAALEKSAKAFLTFLHLHANYQRRTPHSDKIKFKPIAGKLITDGEEVLVRYLKKLVLSHQS